MEVSTFHCRKYQRALQKLVRCNSRLFYAAQAVTEVDKPRCFFDNTVSIAATEEVG